MVKPWLINLDLKCYDSPMRILLFQIPEFNLDGSSSLKHNGSAKDLASVMENFKKISQNQLNTQVTSSSSQQVIKLTTTVMELRNMLFQTNIYIFSCTGTIVVMTIRSKIKMFRECIWEWEQAFIPDLITFDVNSCIFAIILQRPRSVFF